ncbi:DNA gyrase inhibitor YacG [Pontivivens ytuae]|uniref:DNA gyrase inhibitor YacG n=1 Tax=Pontivivens ytuae TaxID=2789856 RepID=A0A7S9LRB3_9RHOB|nr:DNA gyrase inhibitor YacG [Pontivivens ytuae]QPH53295.1 DNA gyrase inhibitor YacG [Pontivivens ytuae]
MSCPICGKTTERKYRPFCSKHCADVDLSRWFSGAYAVPAEEEDTPDEVEIRPVFRGDDTG